MKYGFILFGLVSMCSTAWCQLEDGIRLNTEEAYDGYSLIMNKEATYLIDNCGEILNIWEEVNNANFHPKLTETGNLIFIDVESTLPGGDPDTKETIWELDWDGAIVNSTIVDLSGLNLRYEVILLPNGNYLCVSRRIFYEGDFINLGFDTSNSIAKQIDGVVEINRNSGEAVWEWNIKDHVIQERDPSANNYGDVSEHPELINMDAVLNYDTQGESFMINGMDYNAERQEIIISVRKMCEVMIIDHSTTTEEAQGHSGGRHGKGGDIVYRWGNPANYGAGELADSIAQNDQALFFQHNPQWIKEGPYKDKIMFFNNGLYRPVPTPEENFSSITVIDPPLDSEDHYLLEPDLPYQPILPEIEFRGDKPGSEFYSGFTSGADFLPNGNVYVTEGVSGRVFELNPVGEIVWEHQIYNADYIYRSHKYPKDHIAFEGKDLSSMGTIEDPPSTYDCELFPTITTDLSQSLLIELWHDGGTFAKLINAKSLSLNIKLANPTGQIIRECSSADREIAIDLTALSANFYLVIVTDQDTGLSKTYKLIKV